MTWFMDSRLTFDVKYLSFLLQFFPHDLSFDTRLEEPEYDYGLEYLDYDGDDNNQNSGSFLDFSQPALSRWAIINNRATTFFLGQGHLVT